jgi:hypothetical protein
MAWDGMGKITVFVMDPLPTDVAYIWVGVAILEIHIG